MPHYTEAQIESANKMDLVYFLIAHGEKVKRIGDESLWEKHQVWIRGCQWYSHYESVGGYAIGFVMKYFGLDFQNAIKELTSEFGSEIKPTKNIEKKNKELVLPPPSSTMNHVYAYLMNKRFISRDVISFFAREKTLYEDAQYHSCIFLGLDESGNAKHCHIRSTAGSFRRTEGGSRAEYSFHHIGESEWLFVFEAPIDMLAFITLHQKEWTKHSYVALCSVSPKAILHQLKQNKQINRIVICLDNDNAGIVASRRIKDVLVSEGYKNVTLYHSHNKDWNEDVKSLNGVPFQEANSEDVKAIYNLCNSLVVKAMREKMPSMIYQHTRDAYVSLVNTNHKQCKEQATKLVVMLLLLGKDECRKTLAPIEWNELEEELKKHYISFADNGDVESRLRQLDGHMKDLFRVYDMPQIVYDRQIFLNPILRAAMDCIRLIYYLERSEE